MADEPTNNDNSNSIVTSRRAALGGVGSAFAALCGGLYLNRDSLDTGEAGTNRKEPENALTEPANPWTKDNLVISTTGDVDTYVVDENSGTGIPEAVNFWNSYLDENTSYNLSLSYEPDASDADINLYLRGAIFEPEAEYDLPSTARGSDYINYANVETLTEEPSETPVGATVSLCGSGLGVFTLVTKHVIGRLIGYDINTGPQDVMTPIVLYGPDNRAFDGAATFYSDVGQSGYSLFQTLRDTVESYSSEFENPDPETIRGNLNSNLTELQWGLSGFRGNIDGFQSLTEQGGVTEYYSALETLVLNDEIAYLEETISLIESALENYDTGEEIINSEEFNDAIERELEMGEWFDSKELFDVQIHREVNEQVWEEYQSSDDSFFSLS